MRFLGSHCLHYYEGAEVIHRPMLGGGFWDEVKGIVLGRLRLGAPKEMGRGE
jgi:hypothetical protein